MLKSGSKTRFFLDEIITSSNEVFKDFLSNMAVEIWKLGNPSQETTKNNNTVMQTAGS
jgi:hypothetical protein